MQPLNTFPRVMGRKNKSLTRLLCQCALLSLIFAATMVVGFSCGQKVPATTAEMQTIAAAKGCPWTEYEEGCGDCHKEARKWRHVPSSRRG